MVEKNQNTKAKELPFKDDLNVKCGRCDDHLGTFGEVCEDVRTKEMIKIFGIETQCPVCRDTYRNDKVFCSNCDMFICLGCLEGEHKIVFMDEHVESYRKYKNNPAHPLNQTKKTLPFKNWAQQVREIVLWYVQKDWLTDDRLKELYNRGNTIRNASYKIEKKYHDTHRKEFGEFEGY